jgi:hypothetical protein
MNKQIRVKLGYIGEPDKDVAAEAVAVVDGLTGNPNFQNLPIDLAVFKAAVDALISLIASAIDGGKTAIVEKNKQRAIVIKMLRQLGHWVEANCKDDLSILKSSGFQPLTMTRGATLPLEGPASIAKVENGQNSGELFVRVVSLARALSYIVRYAAIGADGKHAPWTELPPFSSVRYPAVISGLTPGTVYAFQVRALGKLGYTDWSDSVTRMSM